MGNGQESVATKDTVKSSTYHAKFAVCVCVFILRVYVCLYWSVVQFLQVIAKLEGPAVSQYCALRLLQVKTFLCIPYYWQFSSFFFPFLPFNFLFWQYIHRDSLEQKILWTWQLNLVPYCNDFTFSTLKWLVATILHTSGAIRFNHHIVPKNATNDSIWLTLLFSSHGRAIKV